jgi:hypothetical protein
MIEKMHVINHAIVIDGIMPAKRFAEWYQFLVLDLFMHPLELWANKEFAHLLQAAIDCDVLHSKDLWETDIVILQILQKDANHGLSDRLVRFGQTVEAEEAVGSGSHLVFSKPRVVDPPVLLDRDVVPLSVVWPLWSGVCARIVSRAVNGVSVRRVHLP